MNVSIFSKKELSHEIRVFCLEGRSLATVASTENLTSSHTITTQIKSCWPTDTFLLSLWKFTVSYQ